MAGSSPKDSRCSTPHGGRKFLMDSTQNREENKSNVWKGTLAKKTTFTAGGTDMLPSLVGRRFTPMSRDIREPKASSQTGLGPACAVTPHTVL
ncbi:hypothetical protein C0J52_18085 [Blattella germanica]|nr:hypothetical protein C0J52_18085 [Blattella germanica]